MVRIFFQNDSYDLYRVLKKKTTHYIHYNKYSYNTTSAAKISHNLRDIISFDLRPHTCLYDFLPNCYGIKCKNYEL